jgi:starch synthase
VEIVFVAPEITPYSRSGDVGDVCAALPKALRSIGHKVTVISPLWHSIDPSARGLARRLSGVEVELGSKRYPCTLHDARTTGGVELVFVGQAELFAAPPDPDTEAGLTAALVLAQAAVQVLAARAPAPDVVHAHAWLGAAALPLCAQALPQAVRVLSLHDARQECRLGAWTGVALPEAVRELAGHGADASLLRAGVGAAQRVVASSASEAHDLLYGERVGEGLRQALALDGKLVGIPNGLDAGRWNPLTDPLLPSRFDAVDTRGKARCKDALQLELGLAVRAETPLLACIAGAAAAPSAGLLAESAQALLRNDVQLVIVGGGGAQFESLRALAERAPDRLRVLTAADERVEHRVIAGADLLLLLAREGGHGDLHLCAQRYGALPIVAKTSAMADAVVDCDAELRTGSGFVFAGDDAKELLATLQRALAAFAKPKAFDVLRRRGMQLDVSWERSGRSYEYLYKSSKR